MPDSLLQKEKKNRTAINQFLIYWMSSTSLPQAEYSVRFTQTPFSKNFWLFDGFNSSPAKSGLDRIVEKTPREWG